MGSDGKTGEVVGRRGRIMVVVGRIGRGVDVLVSRGGAEGGVRIVVGTVGSISEVGRRDGEGVVSMRGVSVLVRVTRTVVTIGRAAVLVSVLTGSGTSVSVSEGLETVGNPETVGLAVKVLNGRVVSI